MHVVPRTATIHFERSVLSSDAWSQKYTSSVRFASCVFSLIVVMSVMNMMVTINGDHDSLLVSRDVSRELELLQ